MNRASIDFVVWRIATAQSCEIYEELERGARLAFGVHRAVKLAFVIIATAHHCEHRSVRPHGDERNLLHVALGAEAHENLRHGLLRNQLQVRTKGSAQAHTSRAVANACLPIQSANHVCARAVRADDFIIAGSPLAFSPSSVVIAPASTMASSTTEARCRAPCKFLIGLNCEGALIRPASMADSESVNSESLLSKYIRAAAGMPCTPAPK